MSLETSTRVGGYSRLQPREAKAAFRSRSSCIALLFTASLFRYSTYSSTVEEMLREQNHFLLYIEGIAFIWDISELSILYIVEILEEKVILSPQDFLDTTLQS